MRSVLSFILVFFLAFPLVAQEQKVDRASTGGAQTLEDIMARQKGLSVDDNDRRNSTGGPESAKGITDQLGTLGGASDPELWRAIRYGSANAQSGSNGDLGPVLIQSAGMPWWKFREGPLRTYGGFLLLGTMAALLLFFLGRGRIPVDGGLAGTTITRFKAFERFAHWLLAGSFILLGVTGLLSLFGRAILLPYFGKELNSVVLIASKWVHNNVSWAFMIALVIVFVLWVYHNIPNRTDLVWIKQGGGIFSDAHPPARKFNFGQKIIFWGVIVLGASVSASGLSLLFPFEIPMFAKTFAILNDTGLPQAFGLGTLQTEMSPQQEMQLAQAWHAIVSFVMMAMIIAHIYIGSVGMEGAYSAMGNGEVDEKWAHQHHSIWYDEVKGKVATKEPAE
jgi:formate dehydrogenase subunit gamma